MKNNEFVVNIRSQNNSVNSEKKIMAGQASPMYKATRNQDRTNNIAAGITPIS